MADNLELVGIRLVVEGLGQYEKGIGVAKAATDALRAATKDPIKMRIDTRGAASEAASAAGAISKAITRALVLDPRTPQQMSRDFAKNFSAGLERDLKSVGSGVNKALFAVPLQSVRTLVDSLSLLRSASRNIGAAFNAGKLVNQDGIGQTGARLTAEFTAAGRAASSAFRVASAEIRQGLTQAATQAAPAFAQLSSAANIITRNFANAGRTIRDALPSIPSGSSVSTSRINLAPVLASAREELGYIQTFVGRIGQGFADLVPTQTISSAMSRVSQAITARLSPIGQAIREEIGYIQVFVGRIGQGFAEVGQVAGAAAKRFLTPWADATRTVAGDLSTLASTVAQRVGAIAQPLAQAGATIGRTLSNAIGLSLGSLTGTARNLASGISNALGPIGNVAKGLSSAFATEFARIAKFSVSAGVGIAKSFATAAAGAAQAFAGLVSAVSKIGLQAGLVVGRQLVAGVRSVLPTISSALLAVISPLSPIFKRVGTSLSDAIRSGISQIPSLIDSVTRQIPRIADLAGKALRFDARTIGLGGDLFSGVTSAASNARSLFQNITSSVRDSFNIIKTELTTGFLRQIGYSIANTIQNAFRETFNFIGSQIRDTFSAAFDFQANAADIAALQLGAQGSVPQLEIDRQLAETRDLLRGLAVDPDLIVDLDQATAAATTLAKTGTSLGEIDAGSLREAIRLQNVVGSSEIDFARSGQLIGRSVQQYGLAGQEERITQTLSAALLLSPIKDLNDLEFGFSNAGTAAREFGLSIEEVGASLVTTATAYKSQREAGTGLNTLLRVIAAPTEAQAAAMKELGVNAFDASGEFVGLVELQKQLRKSLAGLTEQQRLGKLSEAFGATGYKFASALAFVNAETGDLEANFTSVEELIQKISQVDLDVPLEIRTSTAEKRLENLFGIIEAAREDIALPLADSIVDPIYKISEIIQSAVTGGEFTTLGTSLAAYFAPALGAADRLIDRVAELQGRGVSLGESLRVAIGERVTDTFNRIFNVDLGPLNAARDIIVDIFDRFNSATIKPLTELLGIGESEQQKNINSGIDKLFRSKAGGVLNLLFDKEQIKDNISVAIAPEVETETTIFDAITNSLDGLGEALHLFADGIGAVREVISGAASGDGSPIAAFFSSLSESIGGIRASIRDADGAEIGSGITDIFTSIRGLYTDIIGIGTENIGPAATEFGNLVSDIILYANEIATGVDAKKITESLVALKAATIGFAAEFVSSIDGERIAGAAGTLVSTITQKFEDAVTPGNVGDLTTAVTKFLRAVTTQITAVFSSQEFADGLADSAGNIISGVVGALRAIAGYELYQGVPSEEIAGFRKQLFVDLPNAIAGFGDTFKESLVDSLIEGGVLRPQDVARIGQAADKAREVIAEKVNKLFSFDDDSTTAFQKITDVASNFKNLLEEARDLEAGPVSLVVGGVTQFIDSVSSAIREFNDAPKTDSGSTNAIIEFAGEILNIVAVFQELTTQPLVDVTRSVSGLIRAVLDAIASGIEGGGTSTTDLSPITDGFSNITKALFSRFAEIVRAADLSGIAESFGAIFRAITSRLTSGASEGENTGGGDSSGLASALYGQLSATLASIGSEFNRAFTNPEFLGSVRKAFTALVGNVFNLMNAGLTLLTPKAGEGGSLGNSVAGFVSGLLSSIAGAIRTVPLVEFAEASSALVRRLTDSLVAAVTGGGEGDAPEAIEVQGAREAASGILKAIVDELTATLANPKFGDDIGASLANLLVALTDGLTSVIEQVNSFLEGALIGVEDSSSGVTETAANKLGEAFSSFIDNILKGFETRLAEADYGGIARAFLEGILNAVQLAFIGLNELQANIENAITNFVIDSLPLPRAISDGLKAQIEERNRQIEQQKSDFTESRNLSETGSPTGTSGLSLPLGGRGVSESEYEKRLSALYQNADPGDASTNATTASTNATTANTNATIANTLATLQAGGLVPEGQGGDPLTGQSYIDSFLRQYLPSFGQQIQGPVEERDAFPSSFSTGVVEEAALSLQGTVAELGNTTAAYVEQGAYIAEQDLANSAVRTEATTVEAEAAGTAAQAATDLGTSLGTMNEPVVATRTELGNLAAASASSAAAVGSLPGAVLGAIASIRAAASASSAPSSPSNPSNVIPGMAGGGTIRGTALVGEEGREIAYNARSGLASLVGVGGPELRSFPAGTSIIPNTITERVLSRGVRSFVAGAGILNPTLLSSLVPLLQQVFTTASKGLRPDTSGFQRVDDDTYRRGVEAALESQKQNAIESAAATAASANSLKEGASAVRASVEQINEILKRSAVTAEDFEATANGTYQDKVDEFVRRLGAAANGGDFQETLAEAAAALEAAGIEAPQDPKELYARFTQAWDDRTLFYADENLRLLNQAALEGIGAAQEQQAALAEKAKIGQQKLSEYLGQYIDASVASVGAALGVSDQGSEGVGGDAGAAGSVSGIGAGISESVGGVSEALNGLIEPLSNLASIVAESLNSAMLTLSERTIGAHEPITSLGARASSAATQISNFTKAAKEAIEEIRKLLSGASGGTSATDPATTPDATAGASALGGSVSGRTLVGEEGQELWYNAAQRTSGIVGRRGAEFVNFAPGTRVVDARRTAEILARSGGSAEPIYKSAAFGTLFDGVTPGSNPGGKFENLPSDFFGGGGGAENLLARRTDGIGSAAASAAARSASASRTRQQQAATTGENALTTADLLTSGNPIAERFASRLKGRVDQSQTRIVVNNNVQIDNSMNNSNNVNYGGLQVQSARSSESVQTDFNSLRLLYG